MRNHFSDALNFIAATHASDPSKVEFDVLDTCFTTDEDMELKSHVVNNGCGVVGLKGTRLTFRASPHEGYRRVTLSKGNTP